MHIESYLSEAVRAVSAWEATWGAVSPHETLDVDETVLKETLEQYAGRLSGNYPFFHPRYAGQMLKPPHPAAVIGYLAAMLVNPNNHALDGGPPTGAMEKEVVRDLAGMIHFPEQTLGHLTSSGTIANLEALWIARSLDPGKRIAFSRDAHYTHARMCEVLSVPTAVIDTDENGRLSLSHVEGVLREGSVGTLAATAGTTGIGAVDPIADLRTLCDRYGVRLHVDAAYGGFYALLAWDQDPMLSEEVARHFRAIAQADSVAVDPHKHGLQPYGCGCILFRDPSVGSFYRHDSPYTYFTSDELHLGEISLECSRAGASAGALWFTLQLLPLKADAGLGPVLRACLRAAADWSARLEVSRVLASYRRPELDIVTYLPVSPDGRASSVDRMSQSIFEKTMSDTEDPVFVSVLRVPSSALLQRGGITSADQTEVRILRSVLMKPEHEHFIPQLYRRIEQETLILRSAAV